MQIKVNIRVPQLAKTIKSQLDQVLPQALGAVASFARDRLTSQAQKKLRGSSQAEYIKGLSSPDSVQLDESSAVVRLVGEFPTAIETGSPSFSIKDAMLKSGKVKLSAEGKPYIDVPFRHGTEEDAKNIQGMPKGIASSMKSAVQQAHSALVSGGLSEVAARMVPTRAQKRTKGRQFSKTLQPSGQKILVQHKRGIYDDMIRVPKMYAKAIQSTYMTIRRISQNSSPSSWIHPGFKPANIFDAVVSEVQKAAPQIIVDILKKAGL